MAINLEYARLLLALEAKGALGRAASVVELGAQSIAVDPEVLARFLRANGKPAPGEHRPAALYALFGLAQYAAIDLNGEAGSLAFDLNVDLARVHGFSRQFDLVSNLGTAEHCFDQQQVFRNVHNLCRPGGLMLHSLPSQGWTNHGFYSYSPKFIADLARANGYGIIALAFTVDQQSELVPYSLRRYQRRAGRDLLLYAVLRRPADAEFRLPLDSHYFGPREPDYDDVIRGHWYYVKGHKPSLRRNATIAVRDAVRALKRRWR